MEPSTPEQYVERQLEVIKGWLHEQSGHTATSFSTTPISRSHGSSRPRSNDGEMVTR